MSAAAGRCPNQSTAAERRKARQLNTLTETADTGDAFFAEAEALFQTRRHRMFLDALEAAFTTHPGEPRKAVDDAYARLAESDTRLITYVESRTAQILAGAR